MLQPKRTKFQKYQKNFKDSKQGNTKSLIYGTIGIKSMDAGYLPSKTLETLRRLLTRKSKRTGKIWVRVFPHQSVTRKPAEVRMGKGKGAPKFWIAKVAAGQILFEMCGISEELVRQATLMVSQKNIFKY